VGYPAPRQDVPGHDLTYQAEAGLIAPPSLPLTRVADLAGAQRTVVAALALLMARDRGDGAQDAEISLAASARLFAEPLMRDQIADPDGKSPKPGRVGVGGLIGRVGYNGKPFSIGNTHTPIVMPKDGKLFLGINDFVFKDNAGSFAVTISTPKD
jgi:crotonobetainyl-CoA:carnitine CoA-transferase CaiB-like acyl-CoA transferase